MLERLSALLPGVKAGAVSGLLILGAGGILVSATTDGNTAVVPDPTPPLAQVVQVEPVADPIPLPVLFASLGARPAPSASPSAKPTASPRIGPPARAECVDAVKRVNDAFARNDAALAALRAPNTTTARGYRTQTDEALALVRRAGVTALHAAGCSAADHPAQPDDDEATKHPEQTIVGVDPKLTADRALLAMDDAMATLQRTLAALPTVRPTSTTRPTPRPTVPPTRRPRR